MSEIFADDTFLARWINDELSVEELEAFKKHPDFQKYASIVKATADIEILEFDEKKEWDILRKKIKTPNLKKGKIVPIRKIHRLGSIAAAILLLIGLSFFFQRISLETHTTKYAETKTFDLPDGSSVHMAPDSRIKFSKRKFKKTRNVKLEGQAFFKVQKSNVPFNVIGKQTEVTVLGTSFNVIDRPNLSQTSCFTGSVAVKKKNNSKLEILKHGQQLSWNESNVAQINTIEKGIERPNWINQKNSIILNKVSLSYAFDELERWYNIEIEKAFKNKHRTYSGGFAFDNLELALQSICQPMFLQYEITESKVVVITEQ